MSFLTIRDPTIKLPFADIPVSFQSFLLLSPSLLIVIALYLHIFYGYWLDLETDYQHLTLGREPSDPPIEYLPTLFSLDHPVPRLLTAFIFYWLVPLVLVAITWKAAARLSWALPLALITGLVTAILVFIKIRRCPASQRQWNRPRWTMMAVIVTCIVAIIYNPQWLERRLNIYRVDFKGQWLAQRDLHSIDACLADLRDAILWGANLQDAFLCGANLQGADLQGADRQRADLWDADLRWTDLGHANLQNASFQGAFLWGANLQDAILQGANLGDADLQEVKGLTEQQILSARIDGGTKLPNYLKRPVP